MPYKNKWVYNAKTRTYKKQWWDPIHEVWRDSKKALWRWRRLPYIIIAITDFLDDFRDYVPTVTSFKILNNRFVARYGEDVFNRERIKWIRDDDSLINAWKKDTLAVVQTAMSLFPFPSDDARIILYDFAGWIAEHLFDILFAMYRE